jgi:sulfate adenylyltransferase
MYRKARAGIIQNFTGISDPYEAPEDAELSIDTTAGEPAEAVQRILGYLTSQGYLLPVK